MIKPTETPEFPEAGDGEEDHYVPPPPPPLPAADPLTKGAWIALIGGPVYLLITVILDWEVPGWAAFLAVAAFIGGFVTLVLRMGDEPRDPDDGAVVYWGAPPIPRQRREGFAAHPGAVRSRSAIGDGGLWPLGRAFSGSRPLGRRRRWGGIGGR